MNDSQNTRRYSVGDTIAMGFALRDENGVGFVSAHFENTEDEREGSFLEGDGGSVTEGTVRVSARVENKALSGTYRLATLDVTNSDGKSRLIHPIEPTPEFYVEPHDNEDKGPEVVEWEFFG